MIKHLVRTLTIGLAALLFAPAAPAFIVNDRWADDLNFITNVQQFNPPGPTELLIFEDYNEDNLIPFPSHDGYAIVDNDAGEPVRFFDKIIQKQGEAGLWAFDFRVHNTTPWSWSDYHFEFWTEDFTQQLDITNILTNWSSDIFLNSEKTLAGVNFWSPASHDPSETGQYVLFLNVNLLPNSFGIRQIATTPEPGSVALWALGLAALGVTGWRQRRG